MFVEELGSANEPDPGGGKTGERFPDPLSRHLTGEEENIENRETRTRHIGFLGFAMAHKNVVRARVKQSNEVSWVSVRIKDDVWGKVPNHVPAFPNGRKLPHGERGNVRKLLCVFGCRNKHVDCAFFVKPLQWLKPLV